MSLEFIGKTMSLETMGKSMSLEITRESMSREITGETMSRETKQFKQSKGWIRRIGNTSFESPASE